MATVYRPNLKKVIIETLVKISAIVTLIIAILVMLEFTAGLDTFMSIPESFGVEIVVNFPQVLLWGFITLVVISTFVLLGVYISMQSRNYAFFDNRTEISTPSMLIFNNTKQVAYKNIVKVYVQEQSFFDGIFNTGTIVFELTGLAQKELSFSFIDEPDQVVVNIQDILRTYQLRTQAEFTERHKIDGLLERGGF